MNARDEYTARISELLYLQRDFEIEARFFEARGKTDLAEECAEKAVEAFRYAYALMTELNPGIDTAKVPEE
jgi:hypothetical protein